TALFLWSAIQTSDSAATWLGALLGLFAAVALGWAIYRGVVAINLARFFTWTGALLIVVAAGVLAYAVHDLQEARLLPGPFPAVPEGVSRFAAGWYGEDAWAFRVSDTIAPTGLVGVLLRGTVGFSPEMTKLEVVVWASYLVVVMTAYLVLHHRTRRPL